MSEIKLQAHYSPSVDQKRAIQSLTENSSKNNAQVLLGVTGSGKTFTMANLINNLKKPSLILAHNKTLAAQLYQEFKELFPNNAVEYFISYYDYYQPESYIPTGDIYIEKTASVNSKIEKMRLSTLNSLILRDDVIVISSISCIYNCGNPIDFKKMYLNFSLGDEISRDEIIKQLVESQYQRNDANLATGTFRVIGDTIDLILGYEEKFYIRLELFGDVIDAIFRVDIFNHKKESLKEISVCPAKQFVVEGEKQEDALRNIRQELKERLKELPLLEAHRLKKRVNYDLDMIEEIGFCSGIENYSRHFDKRRIGEAPNCLLNFFPKDDFLFFIDESHQTLPQSRAMYNGDRQRKSNLIDYGFRLPSAFDNRPLKFEEFEKFFKNAVFVSATPAEYELQKAKNIVEQIMRPTGLLDPKIITKDSEGQVDDLIKEIKKTIANNNRVLVTTLTKRMAEELTKYLSKKGVNVCYMHSDIDSLDRIDIIHGLRAKEFDVLVGINLLREGLDIPEVELVAILDADKLGFLRDTRSLIQIIGRAARNSKGRVIMYADKETLAMKEAIKITSKRREKQILYNKNHQITPTTIDKKIVKLDPKKLKSLKHFPKNKIKKEILSLEKKMKKAANDLDFELAIDLREQMIFYQEELKEKAF